MTKVREIVHGALRRAQVLDVGEEADADVSAIALEAYNGALAEFVEWGWLASHTAADLNTDVALAAAYEEGLKALVAQRIAGDFGREAPRTVRMQARMVLAQLADAASTAATAGAKFEEGLWTTRPAEPFYRSE